MEKANTNWTWTEEKPLTFDKVKNEIKKNDYCCETNMKTKLSVDAITIGLGAIIWQVDDNGEGRPIAYNSRKPNKVETKYAIKKLEILNLEPNILNITS